MTFLNLENSKGFEIPSPFVIHQKRLSAFYKLFNADHDEYRTTLKRPRNIRLTIY
jgi:hypothetical protein